MNFSKAICVLNCTIVCLLILCSSCLGPKKINKWVAGHYQATTPPKPKKNPDYISITTTLHATEVPISTTEKKTSDMLPLLFYWQFDYKNTCVLNSSIPIANFNATVMSYAASKGLKQKLKDQHVELSLDQVPTTFAIDDKGHLIWVILYAFSWDILTIQPQKDEMVVSYRILQDNTEVKKGTINIPDSDKGIALKMFQSLRKRTDAYLDQYDANITSMTKRVIDELVKQL